MPDFRLIRSAPVSPTCCVFCGSFEGPFVESVPEKEIPGYGRVYLCAANTRDEAGCVVQAARLTGMLGRLEADVLKADVLRLNERARELERELEKRDDPVVLSRREFDQLARDEPEPVENEHLPSEYRKKVEAGLLGGFLKGEDES